MATRLSPLWILAFSLAIWPRPAEAWGPVGHKAIAMIAQSRLDPQTLQKIRMIMGRNINLDWIANCADVFAHSDGPVLCAGTVTMDGDPEQSKPWHFIDIPISESPNASSLTGYCPNQQDCVVAQIRKDMDVLQDPGASMEAKQLALVYLVHFVGDAHQPLHCADDNDEGGNFKPVDVEARSGDNKYLNLHQVWDHAIDNPGDNENLLAP